MRGRILEQALTRREMLGFAAAAASLAVLPSARADVIEEDLDTYIHRQMRAGRIPGLSVAVVRDTDTIWSRGYGRANIPHELRATKDVEFMLASVSKTITGVAVMKAVEDGLIDLDADVNDVLPFSVRNPEFPDDPITTRMLLTHTSTISDNWGVLTDVYVEGDSPMALGDFLAGYLTPGGRSYDAERNFLSGHPGARYRYGNVAVALAAYLVEAASGTAFDAWCDERIFAPLAMQQTSWHLRGMERRGIAMPYRYVVTQDRYRAYGQYGYPDYPDGQLRSSAAELARFLLAFIRLGELDGARILQEETVREMRRSQVPDLIAGQGLIWYVLHRRGERLWGHNGGDSGVATQMFFRPTDGTGVITLANGDWRRDGVTWPLSLLMDRLFLEADRLG
jgi:CubicO group peptidase (beta-lactamase class C family)